jgi:hypothetical protein
MVEYRRADYQADPARLQRSRFRYVIYSSLFHRRPGFPCKLFPGSLMVIFIIQTGVTTMHYPLIISKTLKNLGIATLSAGLLILSGCSGDQQESATEAMEEVQESAAEAVETAGDETAEAVGASEEAAAESSAGEEEGVWDKTKEVSKDAWDKTKEVSKETWEKTKDEAAEPPVEADAQTKQIEDR